MTTVGEKVGSDRESVVLRTERGMAALPLLRVVIGGIASRQNLNVEQLDDAQLAIETLLAEEPDTEGSLVLEVWCESKGLEFCLGGLVNPRVRCALAAESSRQSGEWLLDVRVLLESLVDHFSVEDGAGGTFAVRMSKWA